MVSTRQKPHSENPDLNEAAGAADATRAKLDESCRNVAYWLTAFTFGLFLQLP